MWDDWLRDMPQSLIASQKPWLLLAYFPLLFLWDCGSSSSHCRLSQPELTDHLTPGRSFGSISDISLIPPDRSSPQTGGGTPIAPWGAHSPTFEFLCKNRISFPIPTRPPCLISKYSNSAFSCFLGYYILQYCQKQLTMSFFFSTCFQRRN